MKNSKRETRPSRHLIRQFLTLCMFCACLGSIPTASAAEKPPLVGKYVASKVVNDWNYAEITADDKGLKWTNKAGKSWRLGIMLDGAQPDKAWIVIGEGAPASYKGKKMEFVKDASGAVIKLIDEHGGVWLRKDW